MVKVFFSIGVLEIVIELCMYLLHVSNEKLQFENLRWEIKYHI